MTAPGTQTLAVLREVATERHEQYAKHGDQAHLPDGTGPHVGWRFDGAARTLANVARGMVYERVKTGDIAFAHILLEEVFEALAEADPLRLRAELVQVAAVTVQWIEAIDDRVEVLLEAARHLVADHTATIEPRPGEDRWTIQPGQGGGRIVTTKQLERRATRLAAEPPSGRCHCGSRHHLADEHFEKASV